MSPRTIDVAIPCMRFTAQVHLAPSEGLSPMEQFALRFMVAGADTAEKVAEAMGLDPRVGLDLCVDLLRGGFIAIDREQGRLVVHEGVRDEMRDPVNPAPDWPRRLSSSRVPEAKDVWLLQDLVSGSVFGDAAELRRGEIRRWAPENQLVPAVDAIPKPTLMVSVASALAASSGDKGREVRGLPRSALHASKVVDVSVRSAAAPLGEVAALAERDRIIVQLRVLRGKAEGDPPDFRVIGPPRLPAGVRQAIASGLRTLWEQGVAREKDQFFGRLPLEDAPDEVERVDETSNPASYVAEMQEALKELEAARESELSVFSGRHETLRDLEATAGGQILDAASYRGRASLVVGTPAHHDLVMRALREAKQQVILACPWVRQLERNDELRDAMVDAVSRGVRIHLVWGVDRLAEQDSEFGPRARELLDLLSPRASGLAGLFVAHRPAGIHAKVLVCDLDWALVSSCNFLSSGRDRRTLEIGAMVDYPTAGNSIPAAVWAPVDQRPRSARAVLELARRCRALVSDFRLQAVVSDDPLIFGRQSELVPTDIPLALELTDDSPLHRNVMLDAWRRRIDGHRERLETAGSLVIPVADADHRRLLLDALAHARRRVVVSSEELGIGLLGEVPAGAVRRALERGVEVTIYSAKRSAAHEERLADLEASGARFRTVDLHSKIIVCDDWALVSSFNFLSFEGQYDQDRRVRREIGVRIFDAEVAEQLVVALENAPLL